MTDQLTDQLNIAGQTFSSRLMLGTGKYPNFDVMREAIEASGAQIVTVSIRRVELKSAGHDGLLDALDWDKYQLLPNTAGCQTAEEAVRVAKLGRAATGSNWVKLEVIPDPRYLLPDSVGTFKAAEILCSEGFTVLPYIQPDAVLARTLERVGCATVMPLASPIGSGRGLQNAALIDTVRDGAGVPVVVDAGLGVPSEAAAALEMGADAVLVNTAVAEAQNPVAMARAFALGVQAGRMAYLAGRMQKRETSSPSSPQMGVVCSAKETERLADPEVPI